MTLDFFYMDIKGFISILQQYEYLVMKCRMLTCCGINLICVILSIIEIMVDKHTWGPDILMSSSPHTFQLFENTIHHTFITDTKYRLFYSVTMCSHCPNILGASNVIFSLVEFEYINWINYLSAYFFNMDRTIGRIHQREPKFHT